MSDRKNAKSVKNVIGRAAAAALFESLENRQMFCADHDASPLGSVMGSFPVLPNTPSGFVVAATGNPSATVPALTSRPGASAKLYLDFDGASAMSWGTFNVTATPKYDTDNNTTEFSANELAAIQNIYKRVAEAYSPFNIDVTTIDPGNLTDGTTLRAVIGGNGSWYGSAGGVAYVGGFTNGAPNTVFIFPKMLANGDVKYTADAISHESGHGFGLQHQSSYSGASKTAEYNPGTSAKAPTMGNSYSATRSLWWYGQSSVGSSTYQDDVVVLSNNTNGFGYRTDDTGNVIGSATGLTADVNDVSATGVIENKTDVDVYSFSTLAGPVSFTLSPYAYAGMLDAKLTLLDANGTTIGSANTASLSESISRTLTAGQYYLVVASAGNAGDIGQYTLSGTIVNDPDTVVAPANLAGTVAGGAVNLTWTDMSPNETGFVIQRSDDAGSTWDTIGTNDTNDFTFTDSEVTVGSSYVYRVYATGEVMDSLNSSTATVAITPSAPGGLAFSNVAATALTLDWTDVDGDTGYKVERSLNGTTWAVLTTTSANVSEYANTGLTPGVRYYYRVTSLGSVGNSAAATAVNSYTLCVAPTVFSGTSTATSIALSWTNVAGETGYKVERSTNGSEWTQLVVKALNAVTYTDSGLTAGTTYYYRVKSVNTAGDSEATTLAKKTLLAAPTGLTAAGEGTSKVNLSWTNGDGESGYKIERQNGTAWVLVATTEANADDYQVTGLAAGGTYNFRIKAVNAGGDSLPSLTATATTAPGVPVVTLTTLTTGSIKLAWANLATNNGYKVERSLDGSDWEEIATPLKNIVTYTDTSLETDTLYYYRVRGTNASGNGEYSVVKSTRTLMDAPAGLEATPFSAKRVDLSWTDSEGETGYRIERQNGTAWVTVAETAADATSYSIATLTPGTNYTFRLRAKNVGGVSDPSATDTALTAPNKVGVVTPTVLGSDSIKLTWPNLVGNAGYKIEQSSDGTTYEEVGTTTTNVVAYTATELDANSPYYFRVRATNASGPGEYSTAVLKRTVLPAPTGVEAVANTATQATVSWDATEGATGYKFERKNGTVWALVANLGADVLTRAVTGLKAGTAYLFRVSALSLGGPSAATSATVTTPPSAPALSLTVVTTGNKLTWNNVAGEAGYLIQYTTNGSTWNTLTSVAPDVTTYTHATRNGGLYTYRVLAFNASGSSVPSPSSSRTV